MAVLGFIGMIIWTAVRMSIANPALRDTSAADITLEKVFGAGHVRTVGVIFVRLVDAVDCSVTY